MATGKEDKTQRSPIDNKGASEAGPPALRDDSSRGVRIRFGSQIGFEIVDNSWLSGHQDCLQATSRHGLRVPSLDLDRAKLGLRPIGNEAAAVLGQESTTDTLERDDSGKPFEDLAKHIFQEHAAFNGLY